MGAFASRRSTAVLAWVVALLIIALNIKLLLDVAAGIVA